MWKRRRKALGEMGLEKGLVDCFDAGAAVLGRGSYQSIDGTHEFGAVWCEFFRDINLLAVNQDAGRNVGLTIWHDLADISPTAGDEGLTEALDFGESASSRQGSGDRWGIGG